MDTAHLIVCVSHACVHGCFLFRGHVKGDKYWTGWNITAESLYPVVLTVRFGCIPKRCSTFV